MKPTSSISTMSPSPSWAAICFGGRKETKVVLRRTKPGLLPALLLGNAESSEDTLPLSKGKGGFTTVFKCSFDSVLDWSSSWVLVKFIIKFGDGSSKIFDLSPCEWTSLFVNCPPSKVKSSIPVDTPWIKKSSLSWRSLESLCSKGGAGLSFLISLSSEFFLVRSASSVTANSSPSISVADPFPELSLLEASLSSLKLIEVDIDEL